MSKVYCEECRWYFYLFGDVSNSPRHKCCFKKIERVTPPTPIKRPEKIIDIEYANCLDKNAHNDCPDFDAIVNKDKYDCYD